MKNTPSLNVTGIFKVRSPFTIDVNELYKVIAVRKFEDLLEVNIDIFHEFYEPLGLTEENYKADLAEGASLISLMNEFSGTVYVPDTYILEYPSQDSVNYAHVVLTVTLGAVPESLPFDFLKEQISGTVSDTIGLTPDVKFVRVPTTGAITQAQHGVLEANRLALVKNRTTDRAKLLELQAKYQVLQENYAVLEQLVIDNGLLE